MSQSWHRKTGIARSHVGILRGSHRNRVDAECQALGLGKRGDGPKWALSVIYTMRIHLGDLKYSVLIIILYVEFAKRVDHSCFHYKEKGNCGGGSRVKGFKNVHRYGTANLQVSCTYNFCVPVLPQ